MDKKKQEFVMMVFSGLMLIMLSLITPSNGSEVRIYFKGFMTGGGIIVLALAVSMFLKNKGFKSMK
ncbi:hypothetical protein MKZ24_01795 [Paenibacillus sp. FSL R7-0297]|uniref:hypothetical protein n=1 Tax=unclassified Paenibacillus TaxID=185978 RepID=UPI0004F6ED7C|nr:hypothetical protein [Paenibacillus sp. FSL R5-0912]AIQ39105.1 hypothetical protein R50912_02860 [Paenibacillus sp. FSL R5-0912]